MYSGVQLMLTNLPKLRVAVNPPAADSPTRSLTTDSIRHSGLLATAPTSFSELFDGRLSLSDIKDNLKVSPEVPWLNQVFQRWLPSDPEKPVMPLARTLPAPWIQQRTCDSSGFVGSLSDVGGDKDLMSPSGLRSPGSTQSGPSETSSRESIPSIVRPTHMLVFSSSIPWLPELCPPEKMPACGECAVNILLLLINCPNVGPLSRVPPPVPGKLPRVVLKLRSVDVFPEFLRYLHHKNHAALFKELIPEWIRDILRSYPNLHKTPRAEELGSRGDGLLKATALKLLRKASRSTMSATAKNREEFLNPASMERSVVDDLVNEERRLTNTYPSDGEFPETIEKAAANLRALKDNIEELGYRDDALEGELVACLRFISAAYLKKSKVSM
ncbi:hypothetical protein GLOTRDRAFT_133570 [Gloeophyllum trabeum ATCC 11539]|uniref:Uncharacterized protein n=1 Tax=Gloeophyllum trabeum (strain ATCC 11539 / FP-39264 / Madison 617) TaxID=670483 RepID=S7PSM8_GLOTA|nr:uncharacterized protein GLOTRDRAFT_133570 [Gloeophyllum trabeum ATCC 11539]EPQ50826.1 hypothetical protein GLOTRDRAFT_133570 [Gloeophyllum trabeum ATCC 11539]